MAQAEVLYFSSALGQRELGVACAVMVEDEDMQVLAVPEGIEINREVALFIRLQVEETHWPVEEEIYRAAGIEDLSRTPALRRGFYSIALGGLAGQGACVIVPGSKDLALGPGIAHSPGIEQDLRALKHVTRKLLGVAPLKDVAKFVPDLSAADVEVWQVGRGATEKPGAGCMAEETKEVKVRKEAGGNDVQARGLARICHVYFDDVFGDEIRGL